MDIYQASERFNISLTKLRRMQKAKILVVDSENPHVGKIRSYIGRRRSIPVLELLHLVENPETLIELGDRAGQAESELAALELAEGCEAPNAVIGAIDRAATNDPEAVETLCDWMKATIPAAREVTYSFLAIRLLLNQGPAVSSYIASRIPRAFLNVRSCEEFAGHCRVDTVKGRAITRYLKPAVKEFDL